MIPGILTRRRKERRRDREDKEEGKEKSVGKKGRTLPNDP